MTSRQFNFDAIGTHWHIEARTTLQEAGWKRAQKIMLEKIDAFDAAWSRFRSDSLVTKMSKEAGSYELAEGGHELLYFYEKLYQATDGKVTPLVGRLMEQAGYDADYSLKPGKLTRPPEWSSAIEYSKGSIKIKKPVLLDFGAAGKGLLVDILAHVLHSFDIKDYVIDASGDIMHRSTRRTRIRVGLENPVNPKQVIGVAEIANQSICASSGSRRKWGDFHHIMDPTALKPVRDVLATWVIADDTMVADGLATALFFAAPDRLKELFKFSYAVLHADMSLNYDKAFPITLFEAET